MTTRPDHSTVFSVVIIQVYKVTLSPVSALLPSANKIRLQELANTELLASLNEPFGKDESEQEVSDDEKEETDFAISEPENELRKLTERMFNCSLVFSCLIFYTAVSFS